MDLPCVSPPGRILADAPSSAAQAGGQREPFLVRAGQRAAQNGAPAPFLCARPCAGEQHREPRRGASADPARGPDTGSDGGEYARGNGYRQPRPAYLARHRSAG